MASFETLTKLAEHPEWIAPRSDTRVFLGEPGAPEATKTTVEAGNVFSPGMGTYGVTWWLRFPDTETFFATETAPLQDLSWRYEGGYLPVVHCDTEVEGVAVRHSLFQDGTAAERSEAVCGRLQLTNTRREEIGVQVFIALRSLGPAGGPVYDLAVGPDERSFVVVGREPFGTPLDVDLPVLGVSQSPSAIGCGVGDPSPLARAGLVPSERSVADPDGWCFGVARFDVELVSGGEWQVHFDCPQQTRFTLASDLASTAGLRPNQYESRVQDHLARWRKWLGCIDLEVPDEEFRNAFYAGLQHMLTAMVGDQVRIAPLVYPLAWLRDGVYVMRCLDLAGLHDVARGATEYCARNDFFGGWGAEGDSLGQGIFALVEHYRITRDKAWLEGVYAAIRRKCEWLFRMRRAEEPIQVFLGRPVMPFVNVARNTGVICVAAQDGLIMGTTDFGVRLGWVNHWALCGLRGAAYAARELGLVADAVSFEAEAAELKAALRAFNDRNPGFASERYLKCLLFPTRAWEEDPHLIESGFNAFWEERRGPGDDFIPEPAWLYREFGTAHNALLLGQRERAWQVIEYRLCHQDVPGLYGYREGRKEGTVGAVQLGVSLFPGLRGYQKDTGITPHGWVGSEMWLLQRGMLVEEWQGALLLFGGVPSEWLKPGARVAFRNFPTWYGKVSADLLVDAQGRSATVTLSGAVAGTPVKIRLPGSEVESLCDSSGALSLQVELEN